LQGNKELASAAFNARVIPSVAYTDPEVAWVGLTEDQAKAQGIKVKKGLFPWTASGRAIANGRDEGVTKLLFDDSPEAHGHGKILGGGMVGTHAGDMIGEIALAIEMGADAVDIGKTIHPHPTLGESMGLAAEVAMEGQAVVRTATIISAHPERVARQIMQDLQRGVTMWPGVGMYSGEPRQILLCAVSRAEASTTARRKPGTSAAATPGW